MESFKTGGIYRIASMNVTVSYVSCVYVDILVKLEKGEMFKIIVTFPLLLSLLEIVICYTYHIPYLYLPRFIRAISLETAHSSEERGQMNQTVKLWLENKNHGLKERLNVSLS